MPNAGIHGTCSTNCMAAEPGTNRIRTKIANANSTRAMVNAEVRTMSSSSKSQSTAAPTSGKKSRHVRIGNVESSWSNIVVVLPLHNQLNHHRKQKESG